MPWYSASAQHSVARKWNEALLEAIRDDFARPTVHARNLFHTSVVLYDSWAVFEPEATPYFLGREVKGWECKFDGFEFSGDQKTGQEEAMSYAAYRLLNARFKDSPGAEESLSRFDSLMNALGYSLTNTSIHYQSGEPAHLGNYIANCMIEYGLQDGSNEAEGYANKYYESVNPYLIPTQSGNPDIEDPNRWQPLALGKFIDQSGQVVVGGATTFLSPEWGDVAPFALNNLVRTSFQRDSAAFNVYHDPGKPPLLYSEDVEGTNEAYKWGFSLVSIWGAHLDPADGVLWDISPGAKGNLSGYPATFEEYQDFYKLEGGDPGTGHELNPKTGKPYEPNVVPRGDYTRVLAEFWADGPDSETPPGHWFTIMNYVNDHPELVKKFKGEGEILDDLEWDVKAYFILGGAMHDAAITAWGIKGWYDYIRPVSALRYMADQGQSSDNNQPNLNVMGIPLLDGYIEIVQSDDPLARDPQNIGRVKLRTWKGPDYISDPETDKAGVGWIMAKNWWPYQRPTFVTPPFAGYISGHSTFSRAAAEVLTQLTGDPFFPGGMGEFTAKKNEFLVFEEGPSVDVTLQWATYKDASDQTSLSRIWGGIHPPADDIPGRIIGEKIGKGAFEFAKQFFIGEVTGKEDLEKPDRFVIYPNPAKNIVIVDFLKVSENKQIQLLDLKGDEIKHFEIAGEILHFELDLQRVPQGLYFIKVIEDRATRVQRLIVK
ncbi:T9SS type A sorting domain-containing protein [Flexithrix dorotheae]|uniref:T9SS type A sorting domain-containing protein n=1 Tax=Flexithrix dorotheae TaxID=70993 RepID=UPI00146AFF6C|nr:T9SS type A sorting domain-containing protein [Flexithrix dorotheae]